MPPIPIPQPSVLLWPHGGGVEMERDASGNAVSTGTKAEN